ncbi:TetR/AcrR family transcriptional regulator [Actinomycetospora termitidis]|uniref:Helix-turn-helix domain-containing protein n=1 Tax=Actinomycetospora termitidis TaxID=3053470 RepID=A0ABT7MG61_9PSEU|nr:TetR/AcrR family transcriptional regulator [Actinomycetospora sp. Odt1-22]MDL5159670.1 helix-turn-helix domain-containing protein [Actinomycetospora sp. Odt1-22]
MRATTHGGVRTLERRSGRREGDVVVSERSSRQRRANGEESRRRILDATVEIAGERGYEGTSINLVSARAGLPASSIYWHFENKDELIAAVIERSFDTWLSAMSLPESAEPPEAAADPATIAEDKALGMAARVADALLESPDFLRLGLMLALERRPEEPRARTVFLRVRQVAHERLVAAVEELAPDLLPDEVALLVAYALAAADGLFISREVGGDSVDLPAMFEMHAHALIDSVARFRARRRQHLP